MDIEFPIYLCAKDSGEIRRFGSIYELQRELEEIDVENGEYWAWDKSGRPLHLSVQKPPWINVSLSTSEDGPSLKKCLEKYSEAIGVKVQVGSSSPEAFATAYQQITNHLQRRRKIGWFARWIFSKWQTK